MKMPRSNLETGSKFTAQVLSIALKVQQITFSLKEGCVIARGKFPLYLKRKQVGTFHAKA